MKVDSSQSLTRRRVLFKESQLSLRSSPDKNTKFSRDYTSAKTKRKARNDVEATHSKKVRFLLLVDHGHPVARFFVGTGAHPLPRHI